MKSWLVTFLAFVVGAWAACELAVVADEQVETTTLRPATFEVAPVLTFKYKEPIKVPLEVTNNSPCPLRYLSFAGQLDSAFFVVLRQEGEILKPQYFPAGTPMSNGRVREIEPGGRLRHCEDISEEYGDLRPGRYELRATIVELGLDDIKLTPIRLVGLLAYIDVE